MNKTEIDRAYKQRGENIFLWKLKAKHLAAAAIDLWNIKPINGLSEHHRYAMLLMGLSLENLLKGLIIKSQKYIIENGKLPREIGIHNLDDLSRMAEVDIKPNYKEKTFLQRLSEQVDWAEKYPIPRKSEDLENSKYGSRKAFVGNPNDLNHFQEIYNKIEACYDD